MENFKKFDAFVKSKNRNSGSDVINWAKRKDYWLGNVSRLYSTIKSRWLVDYIRRNQIEVTLEDMTLHEDFFGEYQTKRLIIKIGGDMLILKPISGVISGGYGRIDIIGKGGTVNLILNDSSHWEYRVKTPFLEFAVLNKLAFLEIIEQFM